MKMRIKIQVPMIETIPHIRPATAFGSFFPFLFGATANKTIAAIPVKIANGEQQHEIGRAHV